MRCGGVVAVSHLGKPILTVMLCVLVCIRVDTRIGRAMRSCLTL